MFQVRDIVARMKEKQEELQGLEEALLSLDDKPYMIKRQLIMPLDKLEADLRRELPFERFKVRPIPDATMFGRHSLPNNK